MFRREKPVVLLRCAVLAAAILVAPSAFAHGYASYGHDHPYTYRLPYRHYHLDRGETASMGSRRHHAHRFIAAAYRHDSSWREASHETRHFSQARMLRAEYMSRASYAVLEARREEREVADERERPITAELNLVQLRNGRERAAEIAKWQLQYSVVSSAKG